MTRNHRFAVPSSFLAPVVNFMTGEQPDWPASNVLLNTLPRQPWRTLTYTADQDLILDFGAATVLSAILLNRTNYPRVRVSVSDDNSSYADVAPTGYDSNGSGLLVPINDYSQRRQLLVDLGNVTHRYLRLRITANQVRDDSAPFYSIGALTVTSNLQQIPLGFADPPDWQIPEPATIKEYPSGAKQVNLLGDPRAIIQIGGQFSTADQKAAFVALHAAGPRPVIIYPYVPIPGGSADAFDPSDAWLMRRTSTTDFKFNGLMELMAQNLQYEEVV